MHSMTAKRHDMADNRAPGGEEPPVELFPVLVVEDDAGLNRLIQKTLQKAGFSTDGAMNGAEAAAKTAQDRDLLLLLDYSLPDMTARELVETLRAKGCRAPFVIMTGYGDERIAVEMMKLNASDYLVKDAAMIPMLPAVIREVTHKLQMERQLEDARKNLRAAVGEMQDLYNNAPCGYHSLDGKGGFIRINDTELRWIGRSREDVVGKLNFADILAPRSRQTFIEAYPRFKEQGWIKALDVEMVRADGTTFFVLLNATAIKDETGAFLMTRSTMFDVTELRQADDERRRLAAAVEHAAEAVVITDTEGITRYVNAAIEQMFGHARDAALGRHIAHVISPGEGQFAERLRDTAETGIPWTGRISGTDIHGTGLVVEATASPIRDDRGRTTELVILLRDITKEIALEAKMRQTQKLEAIGTLAEGVAHDFNNILSAIIGYTQMALLGAVPGSQTAQDLEQVVAAGQRAAELVRQILSFGRRKEQQEHLPLRLDILAKEALNLMRATLPATIEIQSNIANNCDYVMGEPAQLHQVIVNLCTNAYHAMEKEGGVLAFSVVPVMVGEEQAAAVPNLHPGAHLLMTVSDTGCGMEQATLERAFDPFFTTKPQGKGTGLGLSIVHGIVKSHEGAVDLQSAPSKGTTVRVWFPPVKMTAPEQGAAVEAPLAGHGEKILYVDDEEVLAKLGARVLGGLGYRATALTDAREALELFRADPAAFDLMVTDQTMPHCTGLELAARVRGIRPDFPVLLVTGLGLAISEEDAAAAGVAEVLGKPVTSYRLGKSVGRILVAAREAELRSARNGTPGCS